MIDIDDNLSSINSHVVWNYSNAEIFQWTIYGLVFILLKALSSIVMNTNQD